MSHRDPIDALHAVLLSMDGGIAAAAKRVGRSPGIMHNKFSDAMPHYEVTAREAIALAEYAKTKVYAEAICEYFGGVFVELPAGMAGDDDVLQAYLSIIQSMGDLSREFTEARSDGIIEPSEFDALKLRAHRTVGAIQRMLAEIESTVREVPTAGLKAVR
ncbi:MAG: hypothetical protein H6R14_789 [Proteobacteria bacterium]|nr:hypothetical protein [Pseudomonadota bacterium]